MFRHILPAVLFPILLLTGLSGQAVQSDMQTVTVTDGRIADAYNGMAGIFWSFVR